MTKWHKYRDFKPNIKSIIKSKDNSHDTIKARRANASSKRIFLLIGDLSKESLTSQELLERYIEFSKEHDYIWIPIDLFDQKSNQNLKTANAINNTRDTLISELKELKKSIKENETLWIYFATNKSIKLSDKIEVKAKVDEILILENNINTPKEELTIQENQNSKSKVWLKLKAIKNCSGIFINNFKEIDSQNSIREELVKSNTNIMIIEKI